jgi:hypothetical protein
MKFNHNKKRNTAFIYETLIMEFSKASINKQEERKQNILSILKEFFSKDKILKKDLEIYKSFEDTESLGTDLLAKVLHEAKDQFTFLNREAIFENQTSLINKVNKTLSHSVWSNFVPNYKKLATINQALSRTLNPKKQVLIEKKLISMLSESTVENKPFPNVNNLAVKTFIEKFNEQYGEKLNEQQKKLLGHYIMSADDDTEFKLFFHEEIGRLKNTIKQKIFKSDATLSDKLTKIYEKIDNYNNRKIDRGLLTEVIKIQSLVGEI